MVSSLSVGNFNSINLYGVVFTGPIAPVILIVLDTNCDFPA